MIGLDTNLLVRILIRDDEKQTELVRRLLERCHEDGERCLVTTIALCELEWVLTASYKVPRQEVAAAIEGFSTEELFVVEEAEMVREALTRYQAGKGDLSDYLLGARGRELGTATTFTFDKALRDTPDFTLLRSSE